MKLVAIAALLAVCGAAKLDRTYLPPASAVTAGGSPDSLQTPFSRSSSDQGKSSDSLPSGSYTNSFEGVVVDADAAGIRASLDGNQSGLGGPRESYGSEYSKVGDAAFRGSVADFRHTPTFGSSGLTGQVQGTNAGQFSSFESKSERPQAFKDRNSNIITYANDVSAENYSYGFESDNGIAVGENGVDKNGIQAQGGYSYKGDDGQVYKVTYVADEGGYRPQGNHLPTPPPIPKEILESLEKNAKEEAAGIVDDGSYDAQKYNTEGDYKQNNGGNVQYNIAQLSQLAKRPESDAAASNTNQKNQAFRKPGQLGNTGTQNTHAHFNGQSNNFGSIFPNNQGDLVAPQDKQSNQTFKQHQPSLPSVLHNSAHFGQDSGSQLQFGLSHSTQFGSQNNQQAPNSQFDAQSTILGSQTNQPGSVDQFGGHASQLGSATQFGSQPAKPLSGQDSNFPFNLQLNQGNYFGNQAFKHQSSFTQPQNGFGQSSQYNGQVLQTQSGNTGANKSAFGSFVSSKPSAISQGQSQNINNNGNRFPNTPNQLGAEYLPPSNSNNNPTYNNPQPNQYSSFIPLEGQTKGSSTQGSGASAFASVAPSRFEPESNKQSNAFQTQFSPPNRPYYNNQLASQGQTESNNSPTSFQHSGSHAVPMLAFGTKPTSIPEIKLTTPLETNKNPTLSQESELNGQSATNFGNAGSQLLNNQAHTQTGFQGDIGNQQTSSFADSRPQGSSQFDSTSPAPVLTAQQELSPFEQKLQLLQNTYTQNQQNNVYYSTQKPSYSQGPDDSYYYERPSKPFGVPATQGSRFPSSPSYQSYGVVSSQNSQFPIQQGTSTSSSKFPNSKPEAPVAPTPSLQFQQNQSSSTNYHNGITQASISSFPLVSPTTSTQYGSTQNNQFGPKPSINQQSAPQHQFNIPTTQQHSSVPSFPTKPGTTFGQNPSSSSTQNQNLFGQSPSDNNNSAPTAALSFPFNSLQKPSTSLIQNEMQISQNFPANNTQTQQYQGTLYEYNKPAEVLPASEQTDSSSSQSVQTDLSAMSQESQKPNTQESNPQFGSQQTHLQLNQTQISQTQQSNLNQPQFASQVFKPFGSSPSNTVNAQFNQNTQSTSQLNSQGSQNNLRPVKPNGPSLLASSHFSQSTQISSGSKPQFGSQPAKPFSSVSSPSQIGQSIQQPQDTSQTTSFTSIHQTGSESSGVQPLKPFDSIQYTQFGQNMQPSFGSISSQHNAGSQIATHSNKPFGSTSFSQFGQAGQTQSSHVTGLTFTQMNGQNSQTGAQSIKPFGTAQNFQGYHSSKPQFDQLSHNQFTQSSQQGFGTAQINSQPGRGPQIGTLPVKPFGNTFSTQSSPELQKPSFGSTQFNQDVQSSRPSFGQQLSQSSQYGSSTTKPQIGTQTQFIQDQNPSQNKPISNTGVQNQFVQNTAQVSSSAVTQQQPESYKPFGDSSAQGSSFLSQNKPQSGQSSQSSQGPSSISSLPQFGVQPLKPFGISGTFGSQNQLQAPQNKPFDSQQGSACCQGSNGSSIKPLNVGKPSQAFAQTQNQFAGFQGAQGLNAQSVAGKGEEFGGPRQPPSFDTQTGYHY